MLEEDNNKDSEVLKYIGAALLAAGVLVSGLIVVEVFTFFSRPEENTIVNYLTTELSNTHIVDVNGKTITLGESGAFGTSVFLFAMLIWTTSAISFNIIKAAISILTRTYSQDLARLKLYMHELTAKIRENISNK